MFWGSFCRPRSRLMDVVIPADRAHRSRAVKAAIRRSSTSLLFLLTAMAESGRQVPYGHLLFYVHLMKSFSWASEISACLLSCGKKLSPLSSRSGRTSNIAPTWSIDRSITDHDRYQYRCTFHLRLGRVSVTSKWMGIKRVRSRSYTYAFTRKRISVTSLIRNSSMLHYFFGQSPRTAKKCSMSKEMGFCTDCTWVFLNVHMRAGRRTLNKSYIVIGNHPFQYITVVYLRVDTIIKSSAPALVQFVVSALIDSHNELSMVWIANCSFWGPCTVRLRIFRQILVPQVLSFCSIHKWLSNEAWRLRVQQPGEKK